LKKLSEKYVNTSTRIKEEVYELACFLGGLSSQMKLKLGLRQIYDEKGDINLK